MRDGQRRTADVPAANGTSDKSKPRDKGILKAVVNITDIIAHKVAANGRLGTDRIDKLLMDQERVVLSRANSSANATLAIPTTVCRAGAAKSEARLYMCNLEAHRQVHDARALFRRDQWWKSCKQIAWRVSSSCLCRLGAGIVAEDMITNTEVFHTLKFGHQEDVRRDACNVGDETGFAECAAQQRNVGLHHGFF